MHKKYFTFVTIVLIGTLILIMNVNSNTEDKLIDSDKAVIKEFEDNSIYFCTVLNAVNRIPHEQGLRLNIDNNLFESKPL
ncbi:hypothetical protein HZI73_12250 [Vallitalea pronyensis]|uniref:Uncharacterized protein n=1 Tax=Vallitalea pronyensis TaxID=1348613 RepID=A0A8J8MJX4_9FIRM|nr:hypothetical protein [Vallitalea pronyensis]QUI23015.1 hypothetical protein HZI73_12250 [Vallitalea pronyensis]